MEVLNQVIPIYLVFLICIVMYLFAPLFVLTFWEVVSMPVMK